MNGTVTLYIPECIARAKFWLVSNIARIYSTNRNPIHCEQQKISWTTSIVLKRDYRKLNVIGYLRSQILFQIDLKV